MGRRCRVSPPRLRLIAVNNALGPDARSAYRGLILHLSRAWLKIKNRNTQPCSGHEVISVTTLQRLLAQKQQLIERLEEGPGSNERTEIEIEHLLTEIEEELNLLDEAGPGTSDKR